MNFAALTLALMAQLSNWWRRPASAKPTNPKQSKTLRASEPRHQGVRSRVVTHALSQCNDVSRRQLHTRQIRRNASQAGEQFHVTRHCRAGGGTQRGTRVIGDCCGGVRNSSRTCIREPVDGCLGRNAQFVDDEKKLPLCQYRFEQKKFLAIPADFGAIART